MDKSHSIMKVIKKNTDIEDVHLIYHYWKTQKNIVLKTLNKDILDKTNTVLLSSIINQDKDLLDLCINSGANLSNPLIAKNRNGVLTLVDLPQLKWLTKNLKEPLDTTPLYNKAGEGLLAQLLLNSFDDNDNYEKLKFLLKNHYKFEVHNKYSQQTFFILRTNLIEKALDDGLLSQKKLFLKDASGTHLMNYLLRKRDQPILVKLAARTDCNIFQEKAVFLNIFNEMSMHNNPNVVAEFVKDVYEKHNNKILKSFLYDVEYKVIKKIGQHLPYQQAYDYIDNRPVLKELFKVLFETNVLMNFTQNNKLKKKKVLL